MARACFGFGGHANNTHDLWMCVTVNVVLFALLGLLVAAIGKSVKSVVAVYACLCGLITLVEAWGSGFSLIYFSWSVLIVTCLAYWLTFWILIISCPGKHGEAMLLDL
jgi:hypothetical protein